METKGIIKCGVGEKRIKNDGNLIIFLSVSNILKSLDQDMQWNLEEGNTVMT